MKYVSLPHAHITISTNQVEVRDLLNAIAQAAIANAKEQAKDSPQQKTQEDIARVCNQAAKDIDDANWANWLA